jgi:hypothetical protein
MCFRRSAGFKSETKRCASSCIVFPSIKCLRSSPAILNGIFDNLKTSTAYTKLYPPDAIRGEKNLKLKDRVQSWLISSLNDPIVTILAKKSHLTKTQLETLLIDILSENISHKPLNYDEKARLRLTKAKISRGAFNRTLRQAKGNVVKAIYTVLLLGYLGIFETTTLDPYLEISNKLQKYVEAYKNIPNKSDELNEHLRVIKMIREELETSLEQLSNS